MKVWPFQNRHKGKSTTHDEEILQRHNSLIARENTLALRERTLIEKERELEQKKLNLENREQLIADNAIYQDDRELYIAELASKIVSNRDLEKKVAAHTYLNQQFEKLSMDYAHLLTVKQNETATNKTRNGSTSMTS
jgi:hypothetical protein